ncbi:MAG: hypothetical protein BMS9Abin05_1916 [Rhodothermia bacterium]|nr:MAG: hypothetical protein BMS9Abin05_1916 [Rhodothermia bacterium]
MKLSSLDIRKQDFTRVVRGYDKEEVDAFLQLVANQWQELVDDLRREEEKTKDLDVKLEHYQKVEEALEQALKTAKDGAKLTLENAEHKARLVLEEAESKSVDITRNAETERLDIRKDAAKYSVRQKEIVAKLRAFLMSELEILAQYESEAPINYIRLMPAESPELMEEYSETENLSASTDEAEIEALEPVDADSADDPSSEDEAVPDGGTQDPEDAQVDSKSDSKKTASRKDAKPKEPEVSDEIEKIRRILEDLEN